jgi:small subunit ribosomal protein S17
MAENCEDKKCYLHGGVKVRGERRIGRVVSMREKNTVVVEMDIIAFFSKFNRWARRRSRIKAHLPECIKVKSGDDVSLGETRKLSKTKAWTVLEVLEQQKGSQDDRESVTTVRK